jgi:SNF2 family DNA or RNA helicase
VQNFQGGKIPCVAYTHAAGGVGITLHAAETLVLMERSWNPILMSQSLARVHRAGMPDRAVNVIDVVTTGTIEAKQIRRNQEDAELLEDVVKDADRLAKFLMEG